MAGTDFHPELQRLAKVLPRGLAGPRLIRVIRLLEGLPARRKPPADVEVVPVGASSVRLHRPPAGTATSAPAILWIHGGGYVMGSPAQDDGVCRDLAQELGVVVAAVAYRRAPEHPFPVPLDDCHDALVWLAGREDVDPARIAIGGMSAGGGLAASLALLARERDEVRPVFQLLVYPMLDDRTTLRPCTYEKRLRFWNSKSNRYGWRSYLGEEPGGAPGNAIAAPARNEDLAGLPPAWIGVGTLDLFHDEDVAYAGRLRDAGVPCELDVVEGAFHAFDMLAPKTAVSRRFRQAQIDALAAALGHEQEEETNA